jgi:hypothetical protein
VLNLLNADNGTTKIQLTMEEVSKDFTLEQRAKLLEMYHDKKIMGT